MRASGDPAICTVVAPSQQSSALACQLASRALAPAANGSESVLIPTHKVGVKPSASRLILSAVAIYAWWDFERYECHGLIMLFL